MFFLHFYCVIFIVLLQQYLALYANIDLHLTVRPSSFISSINLCTSSSASVSIVIIVISYSGKQHLDVSVTAAARSRSTLSQCSVNE